MLLNQKPWGSWFPDRSLKSECVSPDSTKPVATLPTPTVGMADPIFLGQKPSPGVPSEGRAALVACQQNLLVEPGHRPAQCLAVPLSSG